MILAYQKDGISLYHGDFRQGIEFFAQFDAIVTDPPYGQTSLTWDQWVPGWPGLMPAKSLWCFGSLRMFTEHWDDFDGWQMSQDLVWEKHNGSSFHADRFRRVHEQAVHFYKGEWRDVHHETPTTADAVKKTVRRKERPTHMGEIENSTYTSQDGGPRLMRSILKVRSEHGRAVHPTQKPLWVVSPLIEYACPVGGTICDPFAGSGSTLIAARDLGRNAVGFEISAEYCERAAERLRQGSLAFRN